MAMKMASRKKKTPSMANGMPTSRRSIVTYKATDGATVSGHKTMKLDVTGTYSVGGATDAGVALKRLVMAL